MPDDVLKSSVSHENDRVVVKLGGELDCSNTDELTRLLHHVVGNRARTVVVDMADVTFMDSSGLRCLLQAAEHASSCDAQLVVERASGIVRRVLAVTGTETALTGDVSNGDMRGQSVGS
jgi:anti-sigma B factor antagonist